MLGRVGAIWRLWGMRRLLWRLYKDRRVPLSSKMVVPAAVLYLLFPVDLVPDFLPALGQFDDLTVLLLSLVVFVRLCPQEVVREHLEAMAGRRRPQPGKDGTKGKVIDGQYEILE